MCKAYHKDRICDRSRTEKTEIITRIDKKVLGVSERERPTPEGKPNKRT